MPCVLMTSSPDCVGMSCSELGIEHYLCHLKFHLQNEMCGHDTRCAFADITCTADSESDALHLCYCRC